MIIYVLGGNGFVGSGVVRALERQRRDIIVITRDNYESLKGTRCDLFINANGNSKKFMANREPLWEFDASVRSIAATLSDFEIDRYIHLSTGDVYPKQDSPDITKENQVLDPSQMSRYGLHKYLGELLVRGVHSNWVIFRMGGFIGPNLKKNAIFDMLNDAPVWLARDSELQFISTDKAGDIICDIAFKDVRNEIVNLGAKGVVSIDSLYRKIGSASEVKEDANHVRFEICTEKLESLYGSELPETRAELDNFIGSYKL